LMEATNVLAEPDARTRRTKAVPKRYLDDPTAEITEAKRSASAKTKPQSREQTQQTQQWVSCDDCFKWRRVSKLPKGKRWSCKLNPDLQYDKCSIPQELSDAEIDKEVTLEEKQIAQEKQAKRQEEENQKQQQEDQIIRQLEEAKRLRMEQERTRQQRERDEERVRQQRERAKRQHEVWVNGKRKCRHCDQDAVKGNYGLCSTHGAASRLKRRSNSSTAAPEQPAIAAPEQPAIAAPEQPAPQQPGAQQQIVQVAAQAIQVLVVPGAQQAFKPEALVIDWKAEKLERERQRARERRANASEETKELERQRARDRRACASEEARARERERKKRKRDEAKLAAALVGMNKM